MCHVRHVSDEYHFKNTNNNVMLYGTYTALFMMASGTILSFGMRAKKASISEVNPPPFSHYTTNSHYQALHACLVIHHKDLVSLVRNVNTLKNSKISWFIVKDISSSKIMSTLLENLMFHNISKYAKQQNRMHFFKNSN